MRREHRSAQLSASAQEEGEWRRKHPDAVENFAQVVAGAAGRRVAVFLDYDGTLTEIVNEPDKAFMSEAMRGAVRRVARLFPTGIVTGRAVPKALEFIQLDSLIYAGSHGMDIKGPEPAAGGKLREILGGRKLEYQPAAEHAATIERVCEEMTRVVAGYAGSMVENSTFCVSVHYRNVAPELQEEMQGRVRHRLVELGGMKMNKGKMVLEIKPTLDWDKGKAVEYLVEQLVPEGAFAIYLGDDRTDEDAFRALQALRQPAVTVKVGEGETVAGHRLPDVEAVVAYLRRFL